MKCEEVAFEIVAQVHNVVGFEFQNDSILLHFTLDGLRLETEKIFAKTDKVMVNTNVTWSTTKRDIKRMKAENLPIKVECFRVREREKLELIGYVLIPLRIIPTFLYKNDLLATPRWYKIMGVPNDIVCNKPELHLNVIIQPENECLSETHLRGQIDVEDDDSFADPDVQHHFELKRDLPEKDNPPPVIEGELVAIKKPLQESANEKETEKYVQKLEDWKNEEKENFLTHLKKVENTFLESMFEEWQRKKHEEENKLKWTIEECERLSKKLEEGYAQMKNFNRESKDTEESTRLSRIEEELKAEKKRNEDLEKDLREEREENKQLRNRVREMEKAAIAEANTLRNQFIEETKQLEATMIKLKESKVYYKQKWVELIRNVNQLDHCEDS